MTNIRWYGLTPSGFRALDGQALIIFRAPDKLSAKIEASRQYPSRWLRVMSVVEWEAKEQEEKAAERARQYDNALLARVKAMRTSDDEEMPEQESLCFDQSFWRVA